MADHPYSERLNLDLPDDAGASVTVAVARKPTTSKLPFRSALGSIPHARTRDNDDFEIEFAPLEQIPLKTIESLSVDEAAFISPPCLAYSPG